MRARVPRSGAKIHKGSHPQLMLFLPQIFLAPIGVPENAPLLMSAWIEVRPDLIPIHRTIMPTKFKKKKLKK